MRKLTNMMRQDNSDPTAEGATETEVDIIFIIGSRKGPGEHL
jgi:hypothetical protein